MNPILTEYVLKGIFLGLCAFGSIQAGIMDETPWEGFLRLNCLAWSGLAIGWIWAAYQERANLAKVSRNPISFLLFLNLEHSGAIYNGIIIGTCMGVLFAIPQNTPLLMTTILSGIVLGTCFAFSRKLKKNQGKIWIIFGVFVALGLGMAFLLGMTPWNEQTPKITHPQAFCFQLLAFLPLFYLLTFAGYAEETEVEIGAICVLMGLALGILTKDNVPLRTAGFLIPVGTFFFYTMRILPSLRILKHVLRGLSYSKLGQQANALKAFQRALSLDPQNSLAKNQYWKLHSELDPSKLETDTETMSLVDINLCQDRIQTLLFRGKPSPEFHAEVVRLIILVRKLRPDLGPVCDYYDSVLALHDKEVNKAASLLEGILKPPQPLDHPARNPILYLAWNLALASHPELKNQVGYPLIKSYPSCRMEAITAVEKHLASEPSDQQAWALKRFLYSELLPEHLLATPEGLRSSLDYAFLKDLGLALLEQKHDLARGDQYLEMASFGLPLEAPYLFVQSGKSHDQKEEGEQSLKWFEKAVQSGKLIGGKNLPEASRLAYYSAVKFLADYHLHSKDSAKAIEYFQLFSEFERSGVETLRTLASLYEETNQPLAALRATEQALIYQGSDKDLLARKEKYLFSIQPNELAQSPEAFKKGFDVSFCLFRSKQILDGRYEDPDWIEFARHLAELAMVLEPENRMARVLLGKGLLRQGERTRARELFELARNPKPEKFTGSDDEDAWYSSCQLLADIYMELDMFQEAVNCLQDFRKSPKSGARTWLRLGQALEKLGDTKKAIACYEQATAYEGNPNAMEAQDALYRLK